MADQRIIVNGEPVLFPESMSDAEISEAISSMGQIEGAARLPLLAGSALAKGATTAAGAIGDLEGWLHRKFTANVFDPLHRAVGLGSADRATAEAAKPGPLSSTNLLAGTQAAGITDRPDLQPQTTGEKYLASGAEGVGGMLPYMWMGPLAPAAISRAATQGAASGLAGEAGAQALPQYADAARAVAGLGGMALGGKAFDLGSKINNARLGVGSPTLDAYRNLGIDPALAGDVTGSPAAQMVQNYAGKSLLGGGRVDAARERALGQWGNALDQTASGYGASTTAQEAGTALQAQTRDWMTRWRNAQRTAESNVSSAVPADAAVDLAPVNNVLAQTANTMPGLPSVAGIHQSPVFDRLQRALARDAPTGTAAWSDVRPWRSAVGDQLEQSLLSQDGNQEAWRRLYGSLSQSLGDAAAANGAQAQWQAANQITHQGHQFVENTAGKFLNSRNANTISPEDAYRSAMSGSSAGGSTLESIRREMPTAADELAAVKLRMAGRSRVQNATGDQVSPTNLVSNLAPSTTIGTGLSPEARAALFAGNPDLERRVRDLTSVGERMRSTERFANTSNTGTMLGTGEALGLLGLPALAMMGRWKEAALVGGAAMVPWLAARATTSPAITRFLATQGRRPDAAEALPALGAYYPQLRGLLSP